MSSCAHDPVTLYLEVNCRKAFRRRTPCDFSEQVKSSTMAGALDLISSGIPPHNASQMRAHRGIAQNLSVFANGKNWTTPDSSDKAKTLPQPGGGYW